jgi:hypothetical protein
MMPYAKTVLAFNQGPILMKKKFENLVTLSLLEGLHVITTTLAGYYCNRCGVFETTWARC